MDQDKLDISSRVAAWATNNIKYIAIGAVIGIAIPLILNYQEYKSEQANIGASDLYYELTNLANTSEETYQIADKIFENHSESVYETLTKFILSKKEFENKNYKISRKYLEDIIKNNNNEAYVSLAFIKISLIQIEEKNYDDALLSLEKIKNKKPFKHILSELKGDIYNFKGDRNKSLLHYNEALEESAIDNENLLMKKNSVKD